MSKRMLINATQPEELRVALVDGQWLFDLDIEIPGREQKKGNIYKGRIIRYEPSLEALFVYYGSDRHGFLPIREIAPAYLANTGIEEITRYNIKDILPEGREILIQVDKEERGTKGAALTTFISIAGCYLVLMPNNPRAGGISRRIEGEERAELREILNALSIPDGMGVIIRTAGVGRRIDELKWDLSVLLSQWTAILDAANTCSAPALIHQEGNAVIRAVRDYLRPDIEEMLVDDPEVFDNIRSYIQMVKPDFLSRIKLYEDAIPLFNRYQIESQIETAFKRSVQLPSGGALVIDHTEALVSIDINSARATRGGDIEETALHTNLEAADEIARQLRLRDIGGLIVIDFIDMMSIRNQRAVENRLRQAVEMDRARIQIGRISRFGLLEMSRQRLRPVLGESSRMPCPRCEGQGSIRSVDSQALIVLRVIEEEAIKDNTGEVLAELPVDVATYLMNEKRQGLLNIEKRHSIKIIIIPNSQIFNPQYQVSRVRVDEMASRQTETASYQLSIKTETKIPENTATFRPIQTEEPAVKKTFVPPIPAPQQKTESQGLIKKIISGLFGTEEKLPKANDTRTATEDSRTADLNTRTAMNSRTAMGARAAERPRTGSRTEGAREHFRPEQRNRPAHDRSRAGSPKNYQSRDSSRPLHRNRPNINRPSSGSSSSSYSSDQSSLDRQNADRQSTDRQTSDRHSAALSGSDQSISDRQISDSSILDQPISDRQISDRSVSDQSSLDRRTSPGSHVSPTPMDETKQDRRGHPSKRSGWRGRGRPHHKRRGHQQTQERSQERQVQQDRSHESSREHKQYEHSGHTQHEHLGQHIQHERAQQAQHEHLQHVQHERAQQAQHQHPGQHIQHERAHQEQHEHMRQQQAQVRHDKQEHDKNEHSVIILPDQSSRSESEKEET